MCRGDDTLGILILLIAAALIVYIIAVYNGLVVSRNRVDNGWAQIEVQLQKRFDTVPNLVNTVKGIMQHEQELFESIAKARSGMIEAKSVSEKSQASEQFSNTLKTLFAVSEAYPELKSNQNFLELQRDLKNIEDGIAYSRQFYNDSVTRYNEKIDMFPTNIFANIFNMTKREYFAIENSAARGPVKVEF